MKKTQKKAFGILGLLLVVVMTIFAAIIPGPGATALSSVTDIVEIRVVGTGPHVEFTNPEEDAIYVTPSHDFPYIYDNSETVTIKLEYTDPGGGTHEYVLDIIDAAGAVGSGTVSLDLSGPNYGYGDYVLTITGVHEHAGMSEDSIAFAYYPFTAELDKDRGDTNTTLTLDYDEANEGIDHFEIIIYDQDGEEVAKIPAITVTPPDSTVILPFATNGLPSGTYDIVVTAYGDDGTALFEPYWLTYVYEAKPDEGGDEGGDEDDDSESIVVPDTGGLMGGLNISKSDFLITGLIIFFMVGVGGLYFIIKDNQKAKK